MGVIRSKALMQGARDQHCVRCGIKDGTVVRCHYTGFYQLQFGKGTATKGHDLIAAYLCHRCHIEMDQYLTADNPARDADWLALCFKTVLRDVRAGLIQITGWNQ